MYEARSLPQPRRVTLLLAIVALLATMLPIAPAAAASDLDFDLRNACPPGSVPDSGFVDSAGTHRPAIECLAWWEVTQGRTPTLYGRTANLRRDQTMSLLLALFERIDGTTLPPRDQDAFPDHISAAHRRNVEIMAGFDPPIVRGFPDGTFRGYDPIRRDQFATVVFLTINAIADQVDGLEPLTPGDTDRFADVNPDTNPHAGAIAALADAGLISGRTPTTYRPRALIQRGQAASILAHLLGGLVDGGHIPAPVQVSGIVHDATDAGPDDVGPPVANADVLVLGDRRVRATSAADGSYSFLLLQPGEYDVFATRTGFAGGQAERIELDGTDTTVTANLRLYTSAVSPATSTPTTSGPEDATVQAGGEYWRIVLRDADGPFAARDAEEIVYRMPSGTSIALGAADTTHAWWKRNPDGTSRYAPGNHILYYRFGADWLRLTVTFGSDGGLTHVNGAPWPAP